MSEDAIPVLVKAARNGNLEQVRELLDQGADIHVGDDWALRWATERGHLEVVKYLVEQGANIRAKDDSALRWAIVRNHLEVMRYLVERSGFSIEELLTHFSEIIRDYALKEYRNG